MPSGCAVPGSDMGCIMVWFRCSLCLLGMAVLLVGAEGWADTPQRSGDARIPSAARDEQGKTPIQPASPSAAPAAEKPAATPRPLSLDLLKLPAGAVLVICDEVRDAMRLIPNMIVLRPQDYQKWMEQIEQLKQTEADKPDNPSSCKLTGTVNGDWAYLRATFGFKTERPRSSVNLACLGARPTSATLDGGPASLLPGEEGFLLQVDSPGVHQAILDLQVPLVSRGGGFELDLPRAAIRTVEQLDLPATVSEVRIGNRTLRTTPVEPQRSRVERIPVPTQHLSVAWKGSAAKPASGPPVRLADGRIIVRISETHIFTEAELTLHVRSGEAAEWRLRLPALPADAVLEVKIPPQDEQRIQPIEQPHDKQNPILTIRLQEASAEPLHIGLHIRQARPAGPLAIGPYAVFDALTQRGEIEIHAPDELRLRPQAAGEVSRKEVTEEQRSQNVRAVFSYWNMPGSAQPTQSVPPLLTLHLEPVKGYVETHMTHHLHFEGDAEGAGRWQVKTQLEVTPIRTGVDHLEVSLPADYEYDKASGATPAELVEDVVIDRWKQTAQIKLAHKQTPGRSFTLTLPGSYPVRRGRQEASLELVRPLAWSVEHGVSSELQFAPVLDRGCQVNATLPDGMEFVARPLRSSSQNNGSEAFSAAPLPLKSGSQEYTWQGERTILRLDLAWRAHRPELPVERVVDVILAGQQARVREYLRYQFGSQAPGRLLLAVPPEVQPHVKILEGGIRDAEESRTPDEWAVSIPASAGKEHQLTLEYTFALDSEQRPEATDPAEAAEHRKHARSTGAARGFTVPLIRPVQATRGQTRVRVWCDPGVQPSLAGGSWAESATEIVPEQESLPVLVLRGSHDAKLVLRLSEPAIAHLAPAVADRILVAASVREGGTQSYRVRFLLSKLSARHLDLEMPVLLTRSDLDVRLDGKRVPLHLVDESGHDTDIGTVLRLQVEPALYHGPVILEVSYQADSSRMQKNDFFELTLRPPVLRGAILLGRARWQVDLPAGWLPVCPRGGSNVEQRWGWSGWLVGPRPAWSRTQLEWWLGTTEAAPSAEDAELTLVCWQSALGPLTLVHAPQRVWLLVCSFTVLAIGLVLVLLPLPRSVLWSGVAGTAVAVVAIGVFAPVALPALLYGSQPGVLVLLLVVATQWMLQERYRRQVVFMPGFTRLKTGSSIVRTGSGERPRDPSTVDQPPKSSGQWAVGGEP